MRGRGGVGPKTTEATKAAKKSKYLENEVSKKGLFDFGKNVAKS